MLPPFWRGLSDAERNTFLQMTVPESMRYVYGSDYNTGDPASEMWWDALTMGESHVATTRSHVVMGMVGNPVYSLLSELEWGTVTDLEARLELLCSNSKPTVHQLKVVQWWFNTVLADKKIWFNGITCGSVHGRTKAEVLKENEAWFPFRHPWEDICIAGRPTLKMLHDTQACVLKDSPCTPPVCVLSRPDLKVYVHFTDLPRPEEPDASTGRHIWLDAGIDDTWIAIDREVRYITQRYPADSK